ncbi:predicted protein [Sparassis crispa]|uniref:Uncharacterized protein n=1 Tax=Sparassis crispa TaxID=139825 RepID=A0A401GG01_9APHY|nr:predicted protein [Sparassis crispa]GBE81092.1 predicted protein [Sparassis crispa]
MSSDAGPSQQPPPRPLFGTIPGLLDPSQPDRLLRVPDATLSFASFHPLAASRADNISNRRKPFSYDELSPPKRIVIETIPGPNGGNLWRFVPRARLEHGVESEGSWPRTIEICGGLFVCSQDQWDIYKLDPEYDCFVRASPHITAVSRKKGKERVDSRDVPHMWTGATYNTPLRTKRRLPSPTSDERPSEEVRKRFRSAVNISDADTVKGGSAPHHMSPSDEEDEVEEIIADDPRLSRHSRHPPYYSGKPPNKTRSTGSGRGFRQAEENRRRKRDMFATNISTSMGTSTEDAEMIDLTTGSDESSQPGSSIPPNAAKRKVPPVFDPNSESGSASHPIDITTEPSGPSYKRARTESPMSIRRAMQEKLRGRERQRMSQYRDRANGWNRKWHETFMNDIFSGIPEESSIPFQEDGGSAKPDDHTQQTDENGEDAMHRALIEESQRKMAELQRDKPLWEEAAKKRKEQEIAEERARQAKREQERRTAAAEAEARARQRQAEARAEAERLAQEERARVEREQIRRQWRQQQARWSQGSWTTQRALERYKLLCETFDTTKFTSSDPITFDIVPWPVLHSPSILTVEDVDWTAVESFFHTVKPHMRSQDYKMFVEKSHKRFHPDRWRARGLLKSVEDDELRGCLEVAANTVAQALTPLWREVRGG